MILELYEGFGLELIAIFQLFIFLHNFEKLLTLVGGGVVKKNNSGSQLLRYF